MHWCDALATSGPSRSFTVMSAVSTIQVGSILCKVNRLGRRKRDGTVVLDRRAHDEIVQVVQRNNALCESAPKGAADVSSFGTPIGAGTSALENKTQPPLGSCVLVDGALWMATAATQPTATAATQPTATAATQPSKSHASGGPWTAVHLDALCTAIEANMTFHDSGGHTIKWSEVAKFVGRIRRCTITSCRSKWHKFSSSDEADDPTDVLAGDDDVPSEHTETKLNKNAKTTTNDNAKTETKVDIKEVVSQTEQLLKGSGAEPLQAGKECHTPSWVSVVVHDTLVADLISSI